MSKDKWLTDLSVEELKARILPTPHKPFEIDGIPVFLDNVRKILPDEIFKNHPKFPIEVSNLGRVKFNGNILIQFPDTSQSSPYGYLLVRFKVGFRYSNHRVYTLVAETWCERPDINIYRTVHHISNNGMDNRVQNLLWVTKEQHEEIHPFLKNLNKRVAPSA